MDSNAALFGFSLNDKELKTPGGVEARSAGHLDDTGAPDTFQF